MNSLSRLISAAQAYFPKASPEPISWAERFVKFPRSVRSRHFNISITPWIKEPLLRACQGIWTPPADHYLDNSVEARIITLMKPVQCGGSTFGEILMLYWILFGRGLFQYNWADNDKAKSRWNDRIEGILDACEPVKQKRDRLDKWKDNKCEIDWGNVFLRVQGAFTSDNLDSDSVPLQINEEIHNWIAGHLAKARNRSTAVWNFKSVDISNAGLKGDQLDMAFQEGSAQRWMNKCPGCNKYHAMRTRFDKKRPDLGGLRYDADGSRIGFMQYNYNKIRPTVQFQMPCGFLVHNEDLVTRRQLSLSGLYSEPTNKGAELTHRSYTFEAVTVDYIDWVKLIKDKHEALRALRLGDPEPWRRYCCEVECIPFDAEDTPTGIETVVLTSGKTKNRNGLLAKDKIRLFSLDRQQGEAAKNEFPHWWLVIRDVAVTERGLSSVVVFEGKVETDEQVIAILDEHECKRWHGVADSGDDTTHVYLFCLKYGISAIKGGKEIFYSHEGGVKRIYSPERPLHSMLSRAPLFPYVRAADGGLEPDDREPMFFLYSKPGIRERHHYIKTNTDYQTPEDVSEDYKQHMDAEERLERRHPRTNEVYYEFIQHRKRNDLYVCECYIAMQVDMAGVIGEKIETETKK